MNLIIFGTGDIAQLARHYFENDSPHTVVGFTVDRAFIQPSFEGKPVVPFDELRETFPPENHLLFIALSYKNRNHFRESKYREAKALGYQLPSYLSPRCTYLSDFKPGDNCFILEDNTIQPYVRIGCNVTLWSGNHIGHHSQIDDHNFISSHVVVSGHCRIKPYCFIGVNATLHNDVTVETENIIGAGSIVQSNTNPFDVILPAKSTKASRRSNELNF